MSSLLNLLDHLERQTQEAQPPPPDLVTRDSVDLKVIAVDTHIPLTIDELSQRLLDDSNTPPADRESLKALVGLMRATFHHEFLARGTLLRSRYAPLDPESHGRGASAALVSPPKAATRIDFEAFITSLDQLLDKANYQSLDFETIQRAIAAPNELGLTYVPRLELFDFLRVYVRGQTRIRRIRRTWRTRFRTRVIELEGHGLMVVAFKFRDDLKLRDRYVRRDSLYLRLFKDVPHVDMEMHLPEQGARVKMRWIDKAQIASPFALGIPPLLMKLLVTSLLVISVKGLALLLIAPFSAAFRSFFGFQNTRRRHLHHMIRHLYYLTLANNSAVISQLIQGAEEEETKQALLAYTLLWHSGLPNDSPPLNRDTLDEAIEAWIHRHTDKSIDFDISDALETIERLGLIHRAPSGHLQAIPLRSALARLDHRWDQIFQFNEESPTIVGSPEHPQPGH